MNTVKLSPAQKALCAVRDHKVQRHKFKQRYVIRNSRPMHETEFIAGRTIDLLLDMDYVQETFTGDWYNVTITDKGRAYLESQGY